MHASTPAFHSPRTTGATKMKTMLKRYGQAPNWMIISRRCSKPITCMMAVTGSTVDQWWMLPPKHLQQQPQQQVPLPPRRLTTWLKYTDQTATSTYRTSIAVAASIEGT